jgi:hypothetical protein
MTVLNPWCRSRRAVLAAASVVLAGACRSVDELPGSPARIVVVQGNGQSAAAGVAVTTIPSVQVQDAGGSPVAAVTVHFAVLAGGGSVIGDSAVTDASGRASVGQWVLGTTTGANTLQATVAGTALVTTFTATAVPGTGAAVRLSGQQGYLALVGQPVTPPPAVLVIDSYGNLVPGAVVTFAVATGGGTITGASATTNASGIAQLGSWTLGATAGTNTVTARITGGASLTFTAQGLTSAPVLSATTPTLQAGYLAFPVTTVPRVLVQDALGHALAGVPVTFTVTSGDATVTGGSAISDATGIASPLDWRLGHGSSSTLSASTGLGAAPVAFSATGVAANILIDVRFLTTMTADERDAFVAAARRWMSIITAHLTPVLVNLPAGACSDLQPAMNETVTDLVIFAEVTPIDGVGNVLGSASPCASRSGSDLTVVGTMQFDSADLPGIDANGQLVAVITHEMAHVLGFGTTWSSLGLTSGLGTSDPRFIGPDAVAIWPPFSTALGFPGTTPPLENLGGAGTAGAHWRESVFHAELMTGYIEAPGVFMPLSRMTIATMQDLGYQVDYSQADLFVGNLRAAGSMTAPATVINERIGSATWEVTTGGQTRRLPQ